mmetsp:Transcript_44745/g.124500  ORF Transcript_44745/g.124500 Transcript_44745/m.124500 type:complete len:209 (-) Transcript_44745:809-1435(-)
MRSRRGATQAAAQLGATPVPATAASNFSSGGGNGDGGTSATVPSADHAAGSDGKRVPASCKPRKVARQSPLAFSTSLVPSLSAVMCSSRSSGNNPHTCLRLDRLVAQKRRHIAAKSSTLCPGRLLTLPRCILGHRSSNRWRPGAKPATAERSQQQLASFQTPASASTRTTATKDKHRNFVSSGRSTPAAGSLRSARSPGGPPAAALRA